jgi:anti-sigma regulatory factor (Ser/Thr protein kinase)
LGNGVSLTASDEGQGFDPDGVPDPLAVENLESKHGRGTYFMKFLMDQVSFQKEGTQVHMLQTTETAIQKHDREAAKKRLTPVGRVGQLRSPRKI